MSDLEREIKEAAARDEKERHIMLFRADDVAALLAEKDAERDEWKRIAGKTRKAAMRDTLELGAQWLRHKGMGFAATMLLTVKPSEIDQEDRDWAERVLAGKGE
jgi:hypothetical protein